MRDGRDRDIIQGAGAEHLIALPGDTHIQHHLGKDTGSACGIVIENTLEIICCGVRYVTEGAEIHCKNRDSTAFEKSCTGKNGSVTSKGDGKVTLWHIK